MKKFKLLFLLLFGCGMTVHAQQWIDQNYSFEPIEDILFGTAVGFNGQTDSLYMDLYLPECGDPRHVTASPATLYTQWRLYRRLI